MRCAPGWPPSSSARTSSPWSGAGQPTARHAAQHLGRTEEIAHGRYRLSLQGGSEQGGFQRPCNTAPGKGRGDRPRQIHAVRPGRVRPGRFQRHGGGGGDRPRQEMKAATPGRVKPGRVRPGRVGAGQDLKTRSHGWMAKAKAGSYLLGERQRLPPLQGRQRLQGRLDAQDLCPGRAATRYHSRAGCQGCRFLEGGRGYAAEWMHRTVSPRRAATNYHFDGRQMATGVHRELRQFGLSSYTVRSCQLHALKDKRHTGSQQFKFDAIATHVPPDGKAAGTPGWHSREAPKAGSRLISIQLRSMC